MPHTLCLAHKLLILLFLVFCLPGCGGESSNSGGNDTGSNGTGGTNPDTTFFISPGGDDANPGTLSQPFKTLEHAVQHVRSIRDQHPGEDITYYLREGTHNLTSTLVLNIEDGARGDERVTFAGYQDEQATITSTRLLEGWQLATTDELPDSLQGLSGSVWVYQNPDIVSGKLRFNTMFRNGQRLPRAASRFLYATPFEDAQSTYRPITQEQIDSGKIYSSSVAEMVSEGILGDPKFKPNELCAYLFYHDDNLKQWDNLEDIEVFLYTRGMWLQSIRGLKSVDEVNKRAFFNFPSKFSTDFSPLLHDYEYIAENALEFMDQEGEWVVNTQTGKVYLMSANQPVDIIVPTSTEIIRVEGEVEGLKQDPNGFTEVPVRNITFSSLRFAYTNRYRWTEQDAGIHSEYDLYDVPAALLRLRGADGVIIEESEFYHAGSSAIRLDLYAQNNTIVNNSIHDLGRGGILLIGYPLGSKDVNRNNLVANNHIYNIGQLEKNGMGIALVQSGYNDVRHNLIHNTPFMGIAVLGHFRVQLRDHIEGNKPPVPEWDSNSSVTAFRSEAQKFSELWSTYLHSEYISKCYF